jgi:hypothetical protein
VITVFCNDPVNDTVDLTYAGAYDVVIATGGVVGSVLRCDAETSFSVGTVPGFSPINAEQFYVLWGAIAALFVTAVCVKYVIGVVR